MRVEISRVFAVCRALGDLSGPHFDAARLSMLSSMCQHVSLQFVSYAEKDKVFSLFSTKVLYAACLGKPSHGNKQR